MIAYFVAQRSLIVSDVCTKYLWYARIMKTLATITGRVVRGMGYGKRLGFPTANLDRREYCRKKLSLRLGVYAGRADVEEKNYTAGIVIGPVDKTGLPKIEAYLIGYSGSLYGKRISLHLLRYIRPYRIFKNEDELKKQITNDIQKIVSVLFSQEN